MTKQRLALYEEEARNMPREELDKVRAIVAGELFMLKDKLEHWEHDFPCMVSYVVPGKWSNRGYKKYWEVRGEQVCEYAGAVCCSFPVAELITNGEQILSAIDKQKES